MLELNVCKPAVTSDWPTVPVAKKPVFTFDGIKTWRKTGLLLFHRVASRSTAGVHAEPGRCIPAFRIAVLSARSDGVLAPNVKAVLNVKARLWPMNCRRVAAGALSQIHALPVIDGEAVACDDRVPSFVRVYRHHDAGPRSKLTFAPRRSARKRYVWSLLATQHKRASPLSHRKTSRGAPIAQIKITASKIECGLTELFS